jgi:Zn-dependent protease/predicted transcriptional regulator
MRGFRLGSIAGFEIRVDQSWFIIFFLILWTLGFGVFPAAYPELERSTHLLMAGAGTLLFFASIVAHEIAHSLVARRKGIPMAGITLFIFGGIAQATRDFDDPMDELQVAAAGPAASFAIAALFWAAGSAGAAGGAGAAVVGVASYLAFINFVLAVFNLLPGFPLDGGRMLRALVWRSTGDVRRATRWATNGGKALGLALIALGILNIFAGNFIGGLWLVFIGWFIRMAAEASYSQLLVRRALEDVRATHVMTPDPHAVSPDLSLESFLDEHVWRGRHHSYPVVQDGRPVGMITLERVKRFPRESWAEHTVSEAMLPLTEEMWVAPETSAVQVLERLGAGGAGRVLVRRNGDLVGIVSRSDLVRWIEGAELFAGRREV